MAGSGASVVSSKGEWESFVEGTGKEAVLGAAFFYANFHDTAKPGGQLHQLFDALASSTPASTFIKVDAEDADEIVDVAEIEMVPTLVFFVGGKEVGRLVSPSSEQVAEKVQECGKLVGKSGEDGSAGGGGGEGGALEGRVRDLVAAARVFVVMKGTPQEPKCKFSRAMVELLKEHKVRYGSFNILTDDGLRQAFKDFTGWKTYPMVFLDGKLVGGLDVLKEMAEDGSIKDLQPPTSTATPSLTPEELCKEIISREPVSLIMKGTPDAPRCGFSARMIKLLQEHGIDFKFHDILSTPEIREVIKVVADWPSFPMLFAHGKLVGGLDIVTEMAEDGPLKEQIG